MFFEVGSVEKNWIRVGSARQQVASRVGIAHKHIVNLIKLLGMQYFSFA